MKEKFLKLKEKFLNWVRNKYSTAKKLAPFQITRKPTTVDPDSDARRKFTDAMDSFTGFFGKLAKSFEESNYLQEFITMGELFRSRGYYAGQWGVREDDIAGSADVQVRIRKNLIDEKSGSNQRKLDSEVKILETIRENAERDYKTKNAYYEKLNRAYQYDHKQFSLLLGIIYGAFAVALLLADIPLALELTRRGFNLKWDEENEISNLFAYGSDEGFITNFLKVVTANWEVVLFATGIAFCTIYIKIFYDEYIGTPLENLIKKASEAPRAKYEEIKHAESEENSNPGKPGAIVETEKTEVTEKFVRRWRVRFFVKLGVLLVLFLTIVVLGFFRYSVVSSGTVTAAPIITLATYLLLTLIFPMISGICASLSLSNFHNWFERRKTRKETSAAQTAVLDATDAFRVKEEEKERNRSFIEWLDKEETLQLLTNYLIRCYESGYKFGYLSPEWSFGGDLFTRAEAFRNRNLVDPTPNSPNGAGPKNYAPSPQQAQTAALN